MARIPDGTFATYTDGQVVYALGYNADREIVKVAINDIEDWLASAVVGKGASKIGISPVVGLTSATVRDAIAELQTKIADLVIEQIPIGSISAAMLTPDVVGSKLYTEERYITDGEPVTTSLDDLDMQLFDTETKAESAQTKIGTRLYAENNYIVDEEPITTSLDKLDMAVKDRADNIGNLTYSVNNYITDGEPVTASLEKLDIALAAIIETGSNANGSYIKFEDGTMIQTQTDVSTLALNTASGALYYGYKAWTFPIAFYATPVYVNAVFSGATPILSASSGSINTTAITFHALATASQASISVTSRMVAIGRWKA